MQKVVQSQQSTLCSSWNNLDGRRKMGMQYILQSCTSLLLSMCGYTSYHPLMKRCCEWSISQHNYDQNRWQFQYTLGQGKKLWVIQHLQVFVHLQRDLHLPLAISIDNQQSEGLLVAIWDLLVAIWDHYQQWEGLLVAICYHSNWIDARRSKSLWPPQSLWH